MPAHWLIEIERANNQFLGDLIPGNLISQETLDNWWPL